MRKIAGLVSIVFVLALSMVTGISAQDATPPSEPMGPPESFEIAPGVVADSMIFTEGQDSPTIYRLHFDAGVTYEVAPSGNLELVYMESGSLMMTLDASVTVGTVGDVETGGILAPANTEFTLGTGQFVVMQPGVSGEVRNEGMDTATVSVAGLTPEGVGVPSASPEATPAS
jgi:hypothetical protein